MGTINVQASAAAALFRDRSEEAAESLSAIRSASKEGLRELRAILYVLRHVDEVSTYSPGSGSVSSGHRGGRGALGRSAGTVTVIVQARSMSAVTDLAAFRIIQEALTNTIRHASLAIATVAVRYGLSDWRSR